MWVALSDGELVAANTDLEALMAALGPIASDRRPLIHHIRD